MKRMPRPAGPDLDRVGLWLDDAGANGSPAAILENKYDEKFLENYSTILSEAATGKEIARSMSDSGKKTEFARHVYSNGTEEYFRHFDDLRTTVEEILQKTERN